MLLLSEKALYYLPEVLKASGELYMNTEPSTWHLSYCVKYQYTAINTTSWIQVSVSGLVLVFGSGG